MANNDERDLHELLQGLGAYIAVSEDMVDALQTMVAAVPKIVDTFQKPLLGLGTSLDKLPNQIKKMTTDLPIGFEKAMTLSVESLKAGMFSLDGNTAELAARMEVTGEGSANLFKVLRSQSVFMKSGNAGTASLSKTLRETSDTYHITTSRLVAALDSLSDTFANLRALGGNQNLQESIVEIVGMVGANNEKYVTGFMSEFLSTTTDAFSRASLMGVGNKRERALTGGLTSEELLAVTSDMAGDFKNLVEAVGGPGGIGIQVAKSVLGPMAEQAYLLQSALESMSATERAQLEMDREFNKSWSNFKDVIISPALDILVSLSTWVLEKLSNINMSLVRIAVGVATIATGSLLKGAFTQLAGISKVLSLVAPAFVSFLGPLATFGGLLVGITGILGLFTQNQSKQIALQEDDRRQRSLENTNLDKFQTSTFSEAINKAFGEALLSIQVVSERRLEELVKIREAINGGNMEMVPALQEISENIVQDTLIRNYK